MASQGRTQGLRWPVFLFAPCSGPAPTSATLGPAMPVMPVMPASAYANACLLGWWHRLVVPVPAGPASVLMMPKTTDATPHATALGLGTLDNLGSGTSGSQGAGAFFFLRCFWRGRDGLVFLLRSLKLVDGTAAGDHGLQGVEG